MTISIKGASADRPVLGVSACLLGNPVRFDGGHKHDRYITDSLSTHMDFESVCPETAIGLGIPRATIQLRKNDNEVRLVFSKDPQADLTEQMTEYAEQKVKQLSHLDGFIFKRSSPSCGVFRVPVVVNEAGYREHNETGLFAKAFMQINPLIPVEEEGRLNDAGLRENFFERVYAYRRWKAIAKPDSNVQGLIKFHEQHKLLLMARGSQFYQELGRLVAGTTRATLTERRQIYINRFMEVMKLISKTGRQVNVLQHIMGYLKDKLTADDKRELLSVLKAYRQNELPLITAIFLLKHYFRIYPNSYIKQQHYLSPCPDGLALRSVINT